MDVTFALQLLSVCLCACVAGLAACGTLVLAIQMLDRIYRPVGEQDGSTGGGLDWQTGTPRHSDVYLVDCDDVVQPAILRVHHDDDAVRTEWHLVGQEYPVADDEIDAWFGPVEMPKR